MNDHSHHMHSHQHDTALMNLDPFSVAGFVSMISFSFFVSWHCAAMCAPLVSAQLGQLAHLKKPPVWLYNLGRLISYPTAGAVLGLFSASLQQRSQQLGIVLSLIIGGILILQAFHLLLRQKISNYRWTRPSQRMIAKLSKPLQRMSVSSRMFSLGLITVLLPCMTLTPALLMAAGSGSPATGALLLFAFYAGTLPVMILAPIVPKLGTDLMRINLPHWLAALALLGAGLWTIIRIFH